MIALALISVSALDFLICKTFYKHLLYFFGLMVVHLFGLGR